LRILASVVRAMSRLNLAALIFIVVLPVFVAQPLMGKDKKGSLHELSSVWKDQNGKTFQWKEAQGRVLLVSMVYTSCQQTCPLIMSEMSALQKALPPTLQDKVDVLLFSIDPKRDTPERLKAYALERKLNPNWRLFNGSDDDVLELATVLGFRYKKMEAGDFAHSNIFTVVDQKGQMQHQQLELINGRTETVAVMQNLLKTP
jgi:protein SCO1/2